ncbi:hypothetical protein CTI12_AA222460 [Artemisia annua]|uniref:Sucrose synthase N-terminal domain-containing protein n=1 Tax=Artemisia annua TaxID=35608 RepID=A0A2U1NUE4_ARTAN|nr:hypothetical protein CTI12_AA222460 [Artemisia annua]
MSTIINGTTKAMMERSKRGKIREKRRKEREMERRLKDEDAAVGKMSKINRDRDHEISEIVVLCTYYDKGNEFALLLKRLESNEKQILKPDELNTEFETICNNDHNKLHDGFYDEVLKSTQVH